VNDEQRRRGRYQRARRRPSRDQQATEAKRRQGTEVSPEPKSGGSGGGSRFGFLSFFDSIEKIAVALGAVVVLIGGIIGLVTRCGPEPLPKREAAMTIKDSFPRQFGEFLVDTGQDPGGYSQPELDQRGREYEVVITADGLRNKSAQIVWTLLGDLSGLPFDERKGWIHQFLTSIRPPANSFRQEARVWIQYPPLQGKFRAEMAIEYPEYTALVTVKTRAFAGRKGQPRAGSRPAVTKTVPTVTTIPASVTTAVMTIEGTTTTVTTIDGTTTTTTLPNSSTVTTTTTVPSRTRTVMKTVTIVASTAGRVPIVRPEAKLAPP
jgi:hypothetical protein